MHICERCKKAQATFHLTNIQPTGEKVEQHLCEKCAVDEGLVQQKSAVSFSDILANLVASKGSAAELNELTCESCGLSFVEFRSQGLLGCPHDYDVFKAPLLQMLERAHDGATHHVGKTPASLGAPLGVQQDLAKLKRRLDEAVAAEDYERAAELRDRIGEMEQA